MTHARKIRAAARVVAEASRATTPLAGLERHGLRGRVEGLLIAAHIADASRWTPKGIAQEADAYLRETTPVEVTHTQIMDAYRAGAYS